MTDKLQNPEENDLGVLNDPDEEDFEPRPENCCGRGCCWWGQKYG